MEIELRLSHSYYDVQYRDDTVAAWQTFWKKLLYMAYFRDEVRHELVALPSRDDDLAYYSKKLPSNHQEITFDYSWSQFSRTHKDNIRFVPELEEIYVPKELFDCLGARSLFDHAFPNCKITYWD